MRWVWTGNSPHNVKVSAGREFGSVETAAATEEAAQAGTYTIICTVHGGGDQKMKLVVGLAAAG